MQRNALLLLTRLHHLLETLEACREDICIDERILQIESAQAPIITPIRIKLLPTLLPPPSILNLQLDHIFNHVPPVARVRPDAMVRNERAQMHLALPPTHRAVEMLAELEHDVEQAIVAQLLVHEESQHVAQNVRQQLHALVISQP